MGLNRLKRFTIENLVKICNYSIQNRYVPIDWKSANVAPVYKKGDKTNAGNIN